MNCVFLTNQGNEIQHERLNLDNNQNKTLIKFFVLITMKLKLELIKMQVMCECTFAVIKVMELQISGC